MSPGSSLNTIGRLIRASRIAGASLLGLLVASTTVTAGSMCPADRVVFRDRTKGMVFGVERVAISHRYLCDGKAVEASQPPQGRDCRGPFGDTIYEGFLNGAKVYAVYTVIAGAPCCSWDSYSADSSLAKKRFTWLHASQMPMVRLGSKWLTIEGDETNPVAGPLGGARLVPEICRGS